MPARRQASDELPRWLRTAFAGEDFQELPGNDLDLLQRFGVRRGFRAGETLFRQGDAPDAIFVLEEGEVELVYQTRFERVVLQIVRAGGSLGDLAVLLEAPYGYSAVARTSAKTLAFPIDVVRDVLDAYPHICFQWLRLSSRRLERMHRRVLELAARSATDRLVHFLLHEAEEQASPVVELTQRDLADTLALSRQTVSRVLGDLERQGLIERHRREIHVRDRNGLRSRLPR